MLIIINPAIIVIIMQTQLVKDDEQKISQQTMKTAVGNSVITRSLCVIFHIFFAEYKMVKHLVK